MGEKTDKEDFCKALSGDEFNQVESCNKTNDGKKDPTIKIKTATFKHNKNQHKKIRFHAVIWSGLTTPLKQKLCSDISEREEGDRKKLGCKQDQKYSDFRAKVNSWLKSGLMNTKFSDVVIYLGENREKIQKAFRSAVRSILEENKNNPNASFVIITSSLASHILSESLSEAKRARDAAATIAKEVAVAAEKAQAVAKEAAVAAEKAQAVAKKAAVAAEKAQAVAEEAATVAEKAQARAGAERAKAKEAEDESQGSRSRSRESSSRSQESRSRSRGSPSRR